MISHGSQETPIPVPVQHSYHAWEYSKIQQTIGKARRLEQGLLHHGDRLIDRLLMETQKGEQHEFYFDVTDNILKMEQELSATRLPVRRRGITIGRNDPCPCGSGRKVKKCCGDPKD